MKWSEPLLTASEAQKADKHTIDTRHVSGIDLMERAGNAIAQELFKRISYNTLSNTPIVVVCGPGNNAGDGFVIARKAWQSGIRTLVIALAPIQKLKNEAGLAAKHFISAAQNNAWVLSDLSPCLVEISSKDEIDELLTRNKPVVIVDAIFGTGLKKPPAGIYSDAIHAINIHRTRTDGFAKILSVDLPSGLPADGKSLGDIHIRADFTAAIQFRKCAHLLGPHYLSCGEIFLVDIGIHQKDPSHTFAILKENQPVLSLLHQPFASLYKGNYGHVGVFLGSNGLQGASILSSYAALRAGAGLVSLIDDGTGQIKNFILPEIMRCELNFPLTKASLAPFSALVLGPGIKKERIAKADEILTIALANSTPVIVDAGALGLLKTTIANSESLSSIIATPHPGEAGRLLNKSASEVEIDRLEAIHSLLRLSSKWECDVTWVLKGSCPIVAHWKHGIFVCEGGISSLSVGGSGDVLAGIIAALIAQSDNAFGATILGVTAHLQAGRNLLNKSSRGFFAREIADEIRKVLFTPSQPIL